MQVVAIAKNIRVSARKVRLVADQIKKMSPKDAVDILKFVPKSSSKPIIKVVASAIANAKNNFNLAEDSLKFKELQVGEGRVLKRFRPVSRGRAHSILKRTSHIRVVLEGEEAKKAVTTENTEKESEAKK